MKKIQKTSKITQKLRQKLKNSQNIIKKHLRLAPEAGAPVRVH
jgi:hypothetical protein